MNIKCPNCGGDTYSESVGWKCKKCGGIVDVNGAFHEQVDNPLLPPERRIDCIRRMSTEDFARFLLSFMKGEEYCVDHCYYGIFEDCPNDGSTGCVEGIKKWLEKEMKEHDTRS